MDSNKLRPWQARKIREALQRALGYLTRLQRRMELTGFPPNDPLYVATVKAQKALESLMMDHWPRNGEPGIPIGAMRSSSRHRPKTCALLFKRSSGTARPSMRGWICCP